MLSRLCGIVLAGVGLLALTPAARAQTPSPLAEWQYDAGIQLQRLFEPSVPTWQVEVGAGAVFEPISYGLQRYRVLPGPTIDVRYKDIFFASVGEGVGVNVLSGKNYRIGLAISYDLGRQNGLYASHLDGLNDIPWSPEAKLFAEYALAKEFPLVIRADIRRQLGGTNGWIGDIGAYLPMPGSSDKFAWFAGPSFTFADSRFMNGYFGVGVAESARSGYPNYHASAGGMSATFGVSTALFISPHWILDSSAAITELLGSAANSPITEAPTEGVVTLSLIYKF